MSSMKNAYYLLGKQLEMSIWQQLPNSSLCQSVIQLLNWYPILNQLSHNKTKLRTNGEPEHSATWVSGSFSLY